MAGPDEVDVWIDTLVDAFEHPDEVPAGVPESFPRELLVELLRDSDAMAGWSRHLARMNGVVVGAASLRIVGDIAQLVGGTQLLDEKVTVSGLVPPGHKVATRAIKAGEPVKRYDQIIGFAARDIAPGEHVHLNNLAMGTFDRDYAFGADAKPTRYVTPAATFRGIVRKSGINAGRVATRNYIGILSTVNC